MLKLLLCLLLITKLCDSVDFSTRPTNTSIVMLYFTYKGLNNPVVISPFGVWSLMAGLSFGATGDTGREIFRAFLLLTDKAKFNKQYKELLNTVIKVKTNGVVVSHTNYLFVDEKFYVESDFRAMLLNDYDTVFRSLNFEDKSASADIANGLIATYSAPVNNVYHARDFTDTSLIMSSVFFFKGLWSTPFNVSDTVRESVFSSDKVTGEVNMMHKLMKIPYKHMDEMKATIMTLSFGNDGKYCMLTLTPDPNVSIEQVYKNFESITFKNIFDALQRDTTEIGLKEVDVKLPRFIKTSKLNLQRPLNDMGIYNAFDPALAIFNKMAREPIYIEAIEHNAFISVTETGVIAYATTPGVNSGSKTPDDEPLIMPPLIFFIIEKPTATVLFAGIFP